MSLTIWKQTLEVKDEQDITIPMGADFLCARNQHEQICLWYRCNPKAPTETRRVSIRGTGHPLPPNSQYIDSVLMQNGELVWHIFVKFS